jgi:hypothetical protein
LFSERCVELSKKAASAPQLGQQWRRWLSEESCLRNWLQLSLHFTDDKLPLGAAIKTLSALHLHGVHEKPSRDSFFSLHCCCFGIEMPRGCIWNALTPFSRAQKGFELSKQPPRSRELLLTQGKLFIRVAGRRNLNNPCVYFGKLVASCVEKINCGLQLREEGVGEALELVLAPNSPSRL